MGYSSKVPRGGEKQTRDGRSTLLVVVCNNINIILVVVVAFDDFKRFSSLLPNDVHMPRCISGQGGNLSEYQSDLQT